MATYPVLNKETGEKKDVKMSIHDWDQWKKDNPEWERYFTPENSPGMGIEVGEWRDKLVIKILDGEKSSRKLKSLEVFLDV